MKILLKKVHCTCSCTYSPKSNTYIPFFPGQSSTLSRSHSIASAGDKSLILSTVSSPNTTMHHPGRHVSDVSNERLLHELQMSKKQQACVLLLLFFKMQIWRKNKIKELFFREMKIISFNLTEKVKKEMFFREIVIWYIYISFLGGCLEEMWTGNKGRWILSRRSWIITRSL